MTIDLASAAKAFKKARGTSMREAEAMLREGRNVLEAYILKVVPSIGIKAWYHGWGYRTLMFQCETAEVNLFGLPEGTKIQPPWYPIYSQYDGFNNFNGDQLKRVYSWWSDFDMKLIKEVRNVMPFLVCAPILGFKVTLDDDAKPRLTFMPSYFAVDAGHSFWGSYPDPHDLGRFLRYGAFSDWEKELGAPRCAHIRIGMGLEVATKIAEALHMRLLKHEETERKRIAQNPIDNMEASEQASQTILDNQDLDEDQSEQSLSQT